MGRILRLENRGETEKSYQLINVPAGKCLVAARKEEAWGLPFLMELFSSLPQPPQTPFPLTDPYFETCLQKYLSLKRETG